MKKIYLFIVFILMPVLSGTGTAALINRGGGMIYDSDQNITWLQDANYAKTSGYDSDGRMDWNSAKTWADQLVFGGFDDWRLPDTPPGSLSGGNRTNSEMGYMYYINLGNIYKNGGFDNAGPFVNLQHYWYWSTDNSGILGYAWFFNFNYGNQGIDSKGYSLNAWAVRDGDTIASIPIPSSVLLFSAGLICLSFAFNKKRNIKS